MRSKRIEVCTTTGIPSHNMHCRYKHEIDRQHTPRNSLPAVMCFAVDQVVISGYSNRVVVSILFSGPIQIGTDLVLEGN